MTSSLSNPTALVRALGEVQHQLTIVKQRATELEAENATLKAKTNNRKKLSPFEVRQLRTMWANGLATQRELADYFQINSGTVSRIVNGKYHSEVS